MDFVRRMVDRIKQAFGPEARREEPHARKTSPARSTGAGGHMSAEQKQSEADHVLEPATDTGERAKDR
jgi:hypothetical protein